MVAVHECLQSLQGCKIAYSGWLRRLQYHAVH